MNSFSYLEPVCCSMSRYNCCFLTCMQISQEAGQVVWYSHLLKNFPQFIVIHTVKVFDIVSKAEIDVFLELPCINSLLMLAIWSLVPLPFLKPALPSKVCLVKAMIFPVVVWMWVLDYKDSWVLKNWCFWTMVWRRLSRVSWIARRSNQSILKKISLEYSLEGLMLKLIHHYFGLLMQRTD